MERAREYDRVGEWLAEKKRSNGRGLKVSLDDEVTAVTEVEYGIEARRAQFDTFSYRQPVLAQRPMKPKNYRRGQRDPITDDARRQLRGLQDYNLMDEKVSGDSVIAKGSVPAREAVRPVDGHGIPEIVVI